MLKIILSLLASVLLLLGLISMVTPIPGGTIMIAVSLTTLICTSPRAQAFLRYLRSRIDTLNRIFNWLEEKVGKQIAFIGDALSRTRPRTSVDAGPTDEAQKNASQEIN